MSSIYITFLISPNKKINYSFFKCFELEVLRNEHSNFFASKYDHIQIKCYLLFRVKSIDINLSV